jgi:thiamine biosynthesis lipoprotein
MKRTALIMGMPITVAIPDRERSDHVPSGVKFPTVDAALEAVFAHFNGVDEQFSPYKRGSETSRINRGELDPRNASAAMREVIALSEETKALTEGYFDVWFRGRFDPCGLVKGWAINAAARMLDDDGFVSFCVEAGVDMEVRGANDDFLPWRIGIRSPFDTSTTTKRLSITNRGIATSGTYIRGEHIYDPLSGARANAIASFTVIGPDVYEADRMATAAFAMGRKGIRFITGLPEFDAYMIELDGTAVFTPGFARYEIQ